jgi:hypothetical protein
MTSWVSLIVIFCSFAPVFSTDWCRELCRIDGELCLDGSWNEGKKCHAYVFKGDVTGYDYCYHVKRTRVTCPSGKPVTVVDAERLVKWKLDQENTVSTSDAPASSSLASARPLCDGAMGSLFGQDGSRYQLLSKHGKGSQGDVLLCRREADGQQFAVKRFPNGRADAQRELEVLKAVHGLPGFPQLIDEVVVDGVTHVVMQLLGRSIESIRKVRGEYPPMDPELVGKIGLQMVDRMKTLHSRGYVHMDLYHYNTAMGLGTDKGHLFLMDFGQARPLFSKSLKTDVKSFALSILQLLDPSTPHKKHLSSRARIEDVCKNLPRVMERLLRYSHETLGRDEVPDYELVKSMMMELSPDYSGVIPLE